jgi:hypothetical protein
LIDAFGLQNVLNGLACICSGKADHIESNWQDTLGIPLLSQ